jgi:hypothetical protein
MSNNAQKTALARSLELFANRKTRQAIQQLGQSLPATAVSISGGIVTVSVQLANTTNSPYTIPSLKVPIVGSEFVRLPIQAGTPGLVMTADAYLGGMSGLGGGVADLAPRGNLSALVWTPLGNTAWAAVIDANSLELYGPNGVILHNTAKSAILKVTTAENSWTPAGGNPVTINGNLLVNGTITSTGNVTVGSGGADQVDLQTHVHPGNNQPPTPGS